MNYCSFKTAIIAINPHHSRPELYIGWNGGGKFRKGIYFQKLNFQPDSKPYFAIIQTLTHHPDDRINRTQKR